MKEFKSIRSYFSFSKAVKSSNRYIRNAELDKFLSIVLKTGRKRKKNIRKGGIVYRAQLGNDLETVSEGSDIVEYPCALSPERMKPLNNKAKEGRANPKGIPYLYCTTTDITAISEVRPWVGSLVSLAQFKILNNMKIVDLTSAKKDEKIYFGEPSQDIIDEYVWGKINNAFAQPVILTDDLADYVPTQIIAELFKNNGFDGIAYNSAFENGQNLVLFNMDSADLINCALYEIKNIKYKYEQSSNRYYIKKYYNERKIIR